MTHPLIMLVLGAIATTLLGVIAWFIKRNIERTKTIEEHNDARQWKAIDVLKETVDTFVATAASTQQESAAILEHHYAGFQATVEQIRNMHHEHRVDMNAMMSRHIAKTNEIVEQMVTHSYCTMSTGKLLEKMDEIKKEMDEVRDAVQQQTR